MIFVSESKVSHNRKKSKKGHKRYFCKHKLTTREANFRIWLETGQGISYYWYRTLPPYKRAEFKQEWYAELEATGKSPTARLPKKYQ